MALGIADVVARVSDAAFGRPLVTNILRGQLVEAMLALVLEPEWLWCAADYSGWDFERASDGLRLEVKQSSFRQTWAPPAHGKIRSSFDIRPRSGRWEGAQFIQEPGRSAQIYVFGYHGVADDTADHRCPDQWEFYVIPTSILPPIARLSLSSVRALATPVSIRDVPTAIKNTAALPIR